LQAWVLNSKYEEQEDIKGRFKNRRRESWMDFTLGIGNPDPDLINLVCPAWVHLKRFAVISKVEA
jgi:hypothetical protein